MTHLRTVEEQLATVLAAVRPLDPVVVPVSDALGRTTATAVIAAVDIPVFDNSAMDGFAVLSADVATASADAPVTLRVVADLPAGTDLDPPLRSGEAARIMTGSALPTQADTIVPFEQTADGLADSLDRVRVLRAPAPGIHIRRRGEDLRAGDEVLAAGVELGALQLGAIAAAGVADVTVTRAPRVAVVSTGSELAAPGTPLRRGMIPESNSELLSALVRGAGAEIVLRSTVDDGGDSLAGAVTTAQSAGADAIVFSGGVSEGAFEVVKTVLGGRGVMAFDRVAMQPGKPQGFGTLPDGTLLFGLPGNPVSAAVSFEVFVRRALLAMQRRRSLDRHMLRLPTTTSWRTPPGRRQYVPAVIDRTDSARWSVRPATGGGSGSHLAGGLGLAEAYAIVPAEVEKIDVGDEVDVMLIT